MLKAILIPVLFFSYTCLAQINCDSLLKLVDKTYQQEGPKQATAVLDNIIALHCPDSALAYSNRGFMHNEMEDYANAITDFETAIKIDPANHEAYANESVAYNFLGNHTMAYALVQKAINLSPGNYQYYRLRGDIKYSEQEYDSAVIDYKKSIGLKPGYLELYMLIARTYERMIKIAFDSADAKANNKAKPADPNDVGVQLSDFVHEARDSAEAILTLLINRFPANKLLIFNRAEFYRRNHLYDKAIPDYLQGIKDNKPDAKMLCNLGFCYDGNGDWTNALKYYTSSITVSPNVLAHVNRGRIYKKQGKLELSIADEENAIKLDPSFAQAYLIAGNCYMDLKQYNKAIEYYKNGLAQNPKGEIKSLLQDQLSNAQVAQ